MGIERLIQREKPEAILTGQVLSLDPGNKRLKVRVQGNLEIWISYDPAINVSESDSVLLARVGNSGYLIGRAPRNTPDQVVMVTV